MATKAPRVKEEEGSDKPWLTELQPELLDKIVVTLAADEDILIPRHLCSLARSCKVIKVAVKDALKKLKVEHDAATALLFKCYGGDTVPQLAPCLDWRGNHPGNQYDNQYDRTFGTLVSKHDAPALTNVLNSEVVTDFKSMFMHGNQIGDEGAAAIAAAGRNLQLLCTMDLCNIGIGPAGAQALASAFANRGFPDLQELCLSNNAIGDAGLIALAEALEKGALPLLKGLWLERTCLVGDGLKSLMAAAPRRLQQLMTLDLAKNELSEESVEALVEAIEKGKLPWLRELWIDIDVATPRLWEVCSQRKVFVNLSPEP